MILERYLVNDLNSGQVKVYTHDKSESTNEKVRTFFAKYSIPYTEINLSEMDDSTMIQGALALHTGYQGLPNVYIGEEHAGGYQDLLCYERDPEYLQSLLKEQQIRHKMVKQAPFNSFFQYNLDFEEED